MPTHYYGLRTLLLAGLTAIGFAAAAQSHDRAATTLASIPEGARNQFWLDHRRGWHFYEDPELELPPKPLPPATPPATQRPPNTRAPELVEFEALQKWLEEYRNIAIIRPTEANVRRYMELEASVVRQASYFADVAQRVAWSTPNLDMTLEGRPVNAQAIQVYDRELSTERQGSVQTVCRSLQSKQVDPG